MAIKVNGKLVAGAGKSAYESAKDGGYTGTEDEFNTSLANSVTVDGGGVMSMNESFGAAPFTLTFTEDGENDVSASKITYDNTESGMAATNTQEAIDELFQSVSEGKSVIAAAVTDKGVETAATDSFAAMAQKIGQISTGAEIVYGTFIGNGSNSITVPSLAGYTNVAAITTAKNRELANREFLTVSLFYTDSVKLLAYVYRSDSSVDVRYSYLNTTNLTYNAQNGQITGGGSMVFINGVTYNYVAWKS